MRRWLPLLAAILLTALPPLAAAADPGDVCADRHVQVGPIKVLDGNVCGAWQTYVCFARYYGGPPGLVWTCIPLAFCTFCPGPVLA